MDVVLCPEPIVWEKGQEWHVLLDVSVQTLHIVFLVLE